MVFKALSGGASGNLGNATDQYGYFADVVLVLDSSNYSIFTYENNDLIDASRITASGSHEIYAGAGNDTFFGGTGPQSFHDGSGNDKATMGDGVDTWYCGTGNDIIDGGNGEDWIDFQYASNDGLTELAANSSGVTVDLALTTAQNFGIFGKDTIKSFENVEGGQGNDKISGNGVDNRLFGNSGDDKVDGRAGNDNVSGGDGKDIMIGGRGADTLRGSESTAARDLFKFNAINESGTTIDAQRDVIVNFDNGGTATDDKIDLSAIDARPTVVGNQAFVFRSLGAFSSAGGEIRLEETGGNTLVHVDIDADAADEMTFWVSGVTGLAAADFVL